MNDTQESLFDHAHRDREQANPTRWQAAKQVSPPLFHGTTYQPELDEVRLSRQMQGVYDCMKDGCWRTLAEIHAIVRVGSEASISARLRDFRKKLWGANTVNKQRRGDPSLGIYEYQLIVNPARRFTAERATQCETN